MKRPQPNPTQVLIVDDQVLAQGYMKYSLQELGFEHITYVDQADKALDFIRHNPIDLIICSYNLRQDQEGYYLFDQLQQEHLLSATTAFVFISADTNIELVHSIVELQPDDFLVKPFTVNELGKRLKRLLKRKQAFAAFYQDMATGKFSTALAKVETLLTDPDQADLYPLALKLKGELLLECHRYDDAKAFYLAIINVQNFAWAQFGLIEALQALNEHDEAEKRLLRLAFKPDAQIRAYDMLAAIQLQRNDYDMALESTLMAADISPYNLKRHQQALNIARLAHDYAQQYTEAQKMMRYAKNTPYENPDIYLTVVRSAIDYAMTASDALVDQLVSESQDYLQRLHKQFPQVALSEQLRVVQARIHCLQDEKDNAHQLLSQINHMGLLDDSLEDLLDKAKAFHGIGLYENALALFDEIEQRCRQHPEQSELFLHYIEQEKQERQDIQQSPRELNNNAVEHYQQGDLEQALHAFRQAFTVMPKNPAIALNLMQTLAIKAKQNPFTDNTKSLLHQCKLTIENSVLDEEQAERYEKVKRFFEELV